MTGPKPSIPAIRCCGKRGLYLTLDRVPVGDCEEVLTAETMTGVKSTSRSRFKVATDEQLVGAKQTWKNVKSESMVGTWEWVDASGQPTGNSLEVKPTATDFHYVAKFILKRPDGTTISESTSILEIDLQDQPFYHLMTDFVTTPEGNLVPKGLMFGTAIWSPAGNEDRILTRDVTLNQQFTWIKKGGRHVPDGWVTFTNDAKTFSIDMPPNFKEFALAIRLGKAQFKGFEFAANDPQLGAYFEVIHIDGVDDPDKAVRIIIDGAARLGATLAVGPKVANKFGDPRRFYLLRAETVNGGVLGVGLNLIPVKNGFVAINVAIVPQNVQAAEGVLGQIVNSVQILK